MLLKKCPDIKKNFSRKGDFEEGIANRDLLLDLEYAEAPHGHEIALMMVVAGVCSY